MTCLADTLYPDVGRAVVTLLERLRVGDKPLRLLREVRNLDLAARAPRPCCPERV